MIVLFCADPLMARKPDGSNAAEAAVVAALALPCALVDYEALTDRHDPARAIPVLLEPGSLLVMRGEARYDWKHGIPARKADVYAGRTLPRARRLSLTLRSVVRVEPVNPC